MVKQWKNDTDGADRASNGSTPKGNSNLRDDIVSNQSRNNDYSTARGAGMDTGRSSEKKVGEQHRRVYAGNNRYDSQNFIQMMAKNTLFGAATQEHPPSKLFKEEEDNVNIISKGMTNESNDEKTVRQSYSLFEHVS